MDRQAVIVFLRARLEEEFADASDAALRSLAAQYSAHPDYPALVGTVTP